VRSRCPGSQSRFRVRFRQAWRTATTLRVPLELQGHRVCAPTGECIIAELAQDVVCAAAEFARDREAGADVVDSLRDLQVVGVVG
jgi:hypothetical protein